MKDFKSFHSAFQTLVKALLAVSLLHLALFSESEHPPLSPHTKKAIAAYKQNPSEKNKANLLDALNQSYDKVIAQKQEKLAKREKERDKNINSWLKAIKAGKNPPFMDLQTPNKKASQKQAVANAISTYRQSPSPQNQKALTEALSAYYEAFLDEQRAHISPKKGGKFERAKADESEFLAEIIASYLNAGAQNLPVNPEARVREREFNAQINAALKAYFADKSEANKAKLRTQIQKAFQTAYSVRLEEFKKAQSKGLKGSKALYDKMDKEFIKAQFKELNEQRNLYGRIDRKVSFETSFGWVLPRLKDESKALYEALQRGELSQQAFSALYEKMLSVQDEHLRTTQNKLEGFVDEVLAELTAEKKDKRKDRR